MRSRGGDNARVRHVVLLGDWPHGNAAHFWVSTFKETPQLIAKDRYCRTSTSDHNLGILLCVKYLWDVFEVVTKR
jgi:hypothetical protein